MVMIQDGPQNTGADKPLRISGDPFKVQVSALKHKATVMLLVGLLNIFKCIKLTHVFAAS